MSNSPAPRRASQPVSRVLPGSLEYYKAETAKLRERNQSLHRRLHKYKKYVSLLILNHQLTCIIVSYVHYKKINANSPLFIKVIDMNSLDF